MTQAYKCDNCGQFKTGYAEYRLEITLREPEGESRKKHIEACSAGCTIEKAREISAWVDPGDEG